MPDRAKAIDHLKILRTWCKVNSDYGMGLCVGECKNAVVWLDEALELLKAQEPKLVHVTADINRRKIGECPNCGKWINSGDYPSYCGRCGQEVKWG